jgi:hypothetical protein
VLRILLLVAAAVVSQVGTANGARHARSLPRSVSSRLTVTGEIKQLGLARIAVGGLGCTVPAKLEVSAGRFVIGDPVRIACLNGKLLSVRYSPELAIAQSDKASANAPTVPTPSSSSSLSGTSSIVYSIGVIFLGAGPTGDTSTVTGPISDLSPGSVTAAGLTCSFKPGLTTSVDRFAQVGDTVTLTCTDGQLIHLASVGTIRRTS